MEKHHFALWNTINHIAGQSGKSCSGFAISCGLDSTAFNKCKRQSKYGQPRWIAGNTLVKMLIATNISPIQFAKIYQSFLDKAKDKDN
ncbi:MAG: hypothetical protein IJE82_00395 [Alphaproteobacteria bacterium]|nr:hypothetical protein [Alphaproteobacteria bacterium]